MGRIYNWEQKYMITIGNIIDLGFGLSIMLMLVFMIAEDVYGTKFRATKYIGKFFLWVCIILAVLFAFGFVAAIGLFISYH